MCFVDLSLETHMRHGEVQLIVGEATDGGIPTGDIAVCLMSETRVDETRTSSDHVASSSPRPVLVGYMEGTGAGACAGPADLYACPSHGCDGMDVFVSGHNVIFEPNPTGVDCRDDLGLSRYSASGSVRMAPFPSDISIEITNAVDATSMGMSRGETYCDLTSDGGTDYRYGEYYATGTPQIPKGSQFAAAGPRCARTRIASSTMLQIS